jgi:glycosidase
MHVRKSARDAYLPSREEDAFFSPRGDIVLADPAAARALSERLRAGVLVPPNELAALALFHEILHTVVRVHRERHPASFARLLGRLQSVLGGAARDTLVVFLRTLPPPAVYHALNGDGDDTPEKMLDRGGADVEAETAEEILLLWLTSQNPAYDPVRPVVSDDGLGQAYASFIGEAQQFFRAEPSVGPPGEGLLDVLLAPIRHAPRSIFDQLAFVEQRWGRAFGLDRLALWRGVMWARDVRTEQGKWFARHDRGPGPGEPLLEAMRFSRQKAAAEEPKAFSRDLHWMPEVVLVAKSAYVWLGQLSKKYDRTIERLDQIPDEELDVLAARGFTGLWLIGLFERSRASQRIKQMRGDLDALASAYSLHAYRIADALGGEAAYASLRDRAAQRGIRLAADMVPNHVGLDAEWIVSHPEFFLQTKEPPYPNYRFGGPDLSSDARVGVFLEEGYWSMTDAAVVFRRHDRWTGEDRFIYHGNDGTSMPWNDTAQLDYTKAEVRRAVIETILHVAKMFPIIRFDAAMTLAKKHYQRLWFPLPGTGGAIPSRADHALTEEQFDEIFPVEFWREVVDTVKVRAPETLLLAEAFWMMEGYFVRTLGMHRVYNSAFMNMLKREENEKYRETIKNVLDFDPAILERFVNFMNNPDEDTAIAQFGADDKYFGVCVLMCTLPGLPMFGHGQVEGLREKYGMEFRRAKWNEPVNQALVARHEREIFPLLMQRALFAGVRNFALYDFIADGGGTSGGIVDEDVYAYSNRSHDGNTRALVLYNNRFKNTRGRILRAVPTRQEDGSLVTWTLAEALGLEHGGGYSVFRDVCADLEFIRDAAEIASEGFAWDLHAFEYRVLTGFDVVHATADLPYDRLCEELAGRGVPSIAQAARDLHLRPVHRPLREALGPGHLGWLAAGWDAAAREARAVAVASLGERLRHVQEGLVYLEEGAAPEVVAAAVARAEERYAALLRIASDPTPYETDAPLALPVPPMPNSDYPPEIEEIAAEGDDASVDDGNGTDVADADVAARRPSVDVHLALAWIQLEAVLSMLASGAKRAAPVDPDAVLAAPGGDDAAHASAETEKVAGAPAGAVAGLDDGVVSAPVSGLVSGPEVDLAAAEPLFARWDLAQPVVDAFTRAGQADDERRRAALAMLLATLRFGPAREVIAEALATERGRAYLGVHDADGISWLVKERFEELARAVAEREVVLGRASRALATREALDAARLAELEGYRAGPIAEMLVPARGRWPSA